jgi:hypothetical protein
MKDNWIGKGCGTQGQNRNAPVMWWKRPEGNRPLKELGVHVIILKWILKKQYGRASTGFIWLRIGTSGGLW